jgi:hypothetical protein
LSRSLPFWRRRLRREPRSRSDKAPDLWERFRAWAFGRFGVPGLIALACVSAALFVWTQWETGAIGKPADREFKITAGKARPDSTDDSANA